jgi:hypothetical protein
MELIGSMRYLSIFCSNVDLSHPRPKHPIMLSDPRLNIWTIYLPLVFLTFE